MFATRKMVPNGIIVGLRFNESLAYSVPVNNNIQDAEILCVCNRKGQRIIFRANCHIATSFDFEGSQSTGCRHLNHADPACRHIAVKNNNIVQATSWDGQCASCGRFCILGRFDFHQLC